MDQTAEDAPVSLRPRRLPQPRATVEFLALLTIGILVSRTFAAEAYIVPTGSMAPTLLGWNQAYRCPACGIRFAVGGDEEGDSGRPVCPNCGEDEMGNAEVVQGNGDRLLVQKFAYELRRPRRWEVAVFENPADLDQAFVKRVVGLPGESIQIRGGDVWINGRVARKTLAEQKATRILVYDHDFQPAKAARWTTRVGSGKILAESGWKPISRGEFAHRPIERGNAIDWLEYRHWRPERGGFGPIHDFNAYNGGDLPADNAVVDLMIEAEVVSISGNPAGGLLIRLGAEGEEWTIELPKSDDSGSIRGPELRLNGQIVSTRGGLETDRLKRLVAGKSHRVEASWIDRRLSVAIDGALLFAPIDLDTPIAADRRGIPPALGVSGSGTLGVKSLKIYRDVYYTEALAYMPRRPFGVEEPYLLKAGEYFVLGDNSPVSNDSRFWTKSPVVKADRFLGKPFLVHLPSRSVPLRVFGRELYWIPDPREIRYIR